MSHEQNADTIHDVDTVPLHVQDPFQRDAHHQDHHRKNEELASQVSGCVRIFNVARQVEQVYLEDPHCDDIQHGASWLHPRKVQIAEHHHGLHSNDQLTEGDANGQSTVGCSCHVHHGRTSSEDQPTKQDKHHITHRNSFPKGAHADFIHPRPGSQSCTGHLRLLPSSYQPDSPTPTGSRQDATRQQVCLSTCAEPWKP